MMIRRLPVSIALVLPALLTTLAGPAAAQQRVRPGCLALEGRLPAPDSMVVTVAQARCGPLRLEVAGRPRLQPRPLWKPTSTHGWEVPVALVNTGSRPLQLPLRVMPDSLRAVQRGRRVPNYFSRDLVEIGVREGSERRLDLRFDGAAGATVLRPGQRATATLNLATHSVLQGFRLELSPREQGFVFAEVLDEIETGARGDTTAAPLPADVARFVEAARFPQGSRGGTLFTDAAGRVVVFAVVVPEPGCERRCAQLGAMGLQHGGRIGWISHSLQWPIFRDVVARLDSAWYAFSPAEDAALFRADFLERVRRGSRRWAHFAAYTPDQPLRTHLIRAPGAPRDFLLGAVHALYADRNEVAAWDFQIQKIRDVAVLTALADIPARTFSNADSLRTAVRRQLAERADELAADSSTSSATLFAAARGLDFYFTQRALRLADHPNARSNPAILAVLSEVDDAGAVLAPRLLAAVRAPEAQKRQLAVALGAGREPWPARAEAARALAADPATTEDVLTVLANLGGRQLLQPPAWLATRRLPETALRRWEDLYAPRR